MGISMYLGHSQHQASSTKIALSRQIEGYRSLQRALNDFVYNSGDLSGHAYDSSKAYASTVLIPLTRACILLNEAIAQATADLPSRYVAEVDSTSLHEDQLVDLIAKADQTIVRYRKLWNLEYASDRPNYSLLNSLDRQIDIQQELKRKLQEKLDKLRAFHASSPQIFSAIGSLAQAVNQGMRQAKMSWNSGTQTFDIPSRGDLAWTKAINQQWLDRKVSKTSFKEQVDSLTLAELEKKYKDVLNSSNAYVGAGYDGRYAGLKVSPEEADYIRSRYALLKAQGQMSLYHKEMFDNLRDKDKDEIDKLDIFELTDKYPYLILPRGSSFEFGSDADYAKKNYLYYRFEELMAKQVIDWRDPQFMEKLNAHVNETGINPITGKPATEAEITTAKLYTPVKVASNILAIVALLKGPKVVNKYYSEKVSKGITQTVSVSAEKFSVERLEDRAKKIRAELPTSKLQNRGNIAVADVQIEGLKEEFVAHSKIHSSQSQGASIADFSFSDEKRIFESYVEDRFPRYNDTEAKILEDIASQIKDKDISGTINLYTELPPCQSCSNIIEEFQEMFPNVEINVFFNQD